jgi:hypothetical protein
LDAQGSTLDAQGLTFLDAQGLAFLDAQGLAFLDAQGLAFLDAQGSTLATAFSGVLAFFAEQGLAQPAIAPTLKSEIAAIVPKYLTFIAFFELKRQKIKPLY